MLHDSLFLLNIFVKSKAMKKYLLILLLISFAATEMSLSVQSSFAAISSWSPSAKYAADSAIVISPITDLDSGSHGPRAPMIVPISASYERLISSVILAFTSNLGEIEVEVVNTTTGGYDAGTIDTQLLYATVPITMGPGHYLIIFTLPSGRQYKGEFDI